MATNAFAQQKNTLQPVAKKVKKEVAQQSKRIEKTATTAQPLYQQTRTLKAVSAEEKQTTASSQGIVLKSHASPSIYADIDGKIRNFELKIAELQNTPDTNPILMEKNEAALEKLKQIRSMRRDGH